MGSKLQTVLRVRGLVAVGESKLQGEEGRGGCDVWVRGEGASHRQRCRGGGV